MLRLLIAVLSLTCLCSPQLPDTQEVTCTFQDGHGMRIEYTPGDYELRSGKIWTPAGQPIALFLDTAVAIDNVSLPVGGYGIYILPGPKSWMLIVNKSARPAAQYDSKQDLVRANMDFGDLGHKVDSTKIALLHMAPTQCNIRIYAGSTMAAGEMHEKQ